MIPGILCEVDSENVFLWGIVHDNFSCKAWFTKFLHTMIFCLIFCSKISDIYQISISDINQVIDITTTLEVGTKIWTSCVLTNTYPKAPLLIGLIISNSEISGG